MLWTTDVYSTPDRKAVELDTKRLDILAILAFRYGLVPDGVQRMIADISDSRMLDELISIAKRTEAWKTFIEKLNERRADHLQ